MTKNDVLPIKVRASEQAYVFGCENHNGEDSLFEAATGRQCDEEL